MSVLVNTAKASLFAGQWDWVGDQLKVMLLNDEYVPSVDHQYVSTLSPYELDGTGYEAGFGNSGRQLLGGKAVTLNSDEDRVEFTANNLTWVGINAGTIGTAAIIKEVGDDTTSPILALITSGGVPYITSGADFSIEWDSTGILRFE